MEGAPVTPEMARRYFRLFVNRAAYTVQSTKPDTSGKYYYYRPKGEKRLSYATILQHIRGEITIGLYAIDPKTQRSKWIAIDADYEAAFEDLLTLQVNLRRDNVHSALERSRRGAHLWLFCAAPLLARDCRLYIYNLAHRLGIPIKRNGKEDGIEVFPRQDELASDAFGHGIRGPLGVHRGAGGKRFWFYGADFNPGAQLDYLERLTKITETQMSDLVEGLNMPEDLRPQATAILPPYNPKRPEFRILDYVRAGRREGKDYRTRCPSCARSGGDKRNRHLAISVSDPRKYRCWKGCTKEEIRAALGCPIRQFTERGTWQTYRTRAN